MLYIVATPIGNIAEISLRALDVLKSVSLIAAEDTRRSGMLLKHYGIETPMTAYQKFNERGSVAYLIERLKAGEDIALISDAGMPVVSDPGHILVRECIAQEIDFTVVSGPCAAVNALVLSGLPAEEFCMIGFLPDKQALREEKINRYLLSPATLILYSPPHSVLKDLDFLYCKLGPRRVAAVREMTKKFEQVVRFGLGSTPELTLKGEFVIVVEGFRGKSEEQTGVQELVAQYLEMGLSKMDAIKRAARDKGLSKAEVYKLVNKDTCE